MAITARGIRDELDSALSGLWGSSNRAFGTPEQSRKGPVGLDSLDDRLERAASLARRLIRKGRPELATEVLERWAGKPTVPQVYGAIPNLESELNLMTDLFLEVIAGRAQLNPKWENGTDAEQIRYHRIRDALERNERWPLIVVDIARRAGL